MLGFTNVVGNVGMLAGAGVWLIFELWGVFTGSKNQIDTTSQAAWWIESRWPVMRLVFGVFLASLFAHILFGTWLLP